MTITTVSKNEEALTLVITAEFDASVTRVWQLFEDPRQLERWWGPPTYPATFTDHDLTPGGRMSYFMTGPDGDQPHGWWRVMSIDAPHQLRFENGLADDAGEPLVDMLPMIMTIDLTEKSDGGTLLSLETNYQTPEIMSRFMTMGMEDGLKAAMSQMDGLL
jgi:uncharacterized protein YndB with AHSA1/START domain